MKFRNDHHSSSNLGFTLVELLIVIVVIAILAAISIVAYNGIQERARVSTAKADLRNFGQAVTTKLIDDRPLNSATWIDAMKEANVYEQTRNQNDKSFVLCSNTSTREFAIVAFVPLYSNAEPGSGQPVQVYSGGSVKTISYSSSVAGTYVSEKLCSNVLPSFSTSSWTYAAWTNG